MVMDPEGTATLWLNVVEDKMGELCEEDKVLVRELTRNVLNRWSLRAADVTEGEPVAQALLFKTIYADNKSRAQNVIAAVLELFKAIGAGDALPESYRGLIH